MLYGYSRISTVGQKETSLEVQEHFHELIAQNLKQEFKSIREVGSGKDANRPELQKLIKRVKQGDIVSFYDNSRLGRNTEENLKIARSFIDKGVKVFVAGREFRANEVQDELTFTLESAISTYQRKLQNAKAQASMDLQRAQGNLSTTRIYGYDQYRSKGKHIAVINQEESANVKLVFEKFLNGDSITKISKELGISSWVVNTMVNNPLYAGYYMDTVENTKIRQDLSDEEFKKHLIKSNIYLPIIDFDTFMKVRNVYRLNHKVREYSFRNSSHELTGIYRSSCCGSGFVYVTMKLHGRQEGLIYNYYQNTFPHKGCKAHKKVNFRSEKLERITKVFLILALKAGIEVAGFFAETKNALLQDEQELLEKNDALKQQIDEKKARISRIKTLILDGTIEAADFKEDMTSLKAEISTLEKSIDENERIIDYKNRMIEDVLEEEAKDSLDEFLNSSVEGRRDFYKRFVRDAVIYNIEKLEIEFINTKKFNYEKGSFTMSYLGQEQVKGKITDKLSFDPVEAPDDVTDYLNDYYKKLADEVNEMV